MKKGKNAAKPASVSIFAPARPVPRPATGALPPIEGTQLITLFNAGRYAELENRSRALAAQYPTSGFVWKVLGTALLVQGKDGLEPLQRAVELLPSDVELHSNLGNMLRSMGRLQEALASYQQALRLKPDYADAHYNLGITQQDLGYINEACQSYRQAVKLKPGFAAAHFNLGIIFNLQGLNSDSIASYQQALQWDPHHFGALCNLGIALKKTGQYQAGATCFRKALKVDPQVAETHNNLGNILAELGELPAAVASFRQALQLKPDFAEAGSNLLMCLNYMPEVKADTLLAEAKAFGERVSKRAHPFQSWHNTDPDDTQPLRVGLVSGDLSEHPVGFFIEGVLAALKADPSVQLDITAYVSRHADDDITHRIKSHCQGWKSIVGLPDQEAASLIHADHIDILIDLAGHTANNRLPMFAFRPAPVQATWLGYFATTGVAEIDYLIADPFTLPESDDALYTEKIWRLPDTRFCFTPPNLPVDVGALPALENGHITFGCFNNLTKMNDAVVALWARVLQAVEGSRLFLKAAQFDEAAVRASVGQRFAAQGIPADRLLLEGKSSREAYLAAYNRIDIALDPFPFTGGTTTAEGLWMGVPVLTLAGTRMVSRQGLSLMMNAGLPEWVASDENDYVARAAQHAGDLTALAALRSRLRPQVLASPIFDTARFTRHFVSALRAMRRERLTPR